MEDLENGVTIRLLMVFEILCESGRIKLRMLSEKRLSRESIIGAGLNRDQHFKKTENCFSIFEPNWV